MVGIKDLFVVLCFPKNPAIPLQSKTASRNVEIGDSKAVCRTNAGIGRSGQSTDPTQRAEPLISRFIVSSVGIPEIFRNYLQFPARAEVLAAVEFIDENGGGPGVRLRKPQRSKQSK
jgi:hypothetical protein